MMTAHIRIRDLELILALHEEGNLTRAAQRVGISEPAFSKQLQKIERRIDVRLFERGNGGVATTDSGRSFVVHAVDSVHAFHRALHDARENRFGERHTLRIGVSSFLPRRWVDLLHSVELRGYRDPAIEITSAYSFDLLTQLQHHELDLALVTSPAPNPAITTACAMVMHRKHPLAGMKAVSLPTLPNFHGCSSGAMFILFCMTGFCRGCKRRIGNREYRIRSARQIRYPRS